MLDVFLCHAAADREAAERIAARLERGAEARVWLEECGPQREVTVAWEGGLGAAAIVLVLSPEGVPARAERNAGWQALLSHVEHAESPPVATVIVRDGPYPRLLERKRCFRWKEPEREALREIERWVVSLHPQGEQPAFAAARLPWFEGRQRELELLWSRLVDDAGTVVLCNAAAGSGKTALAQEFARTAAAHFRDVLWVECGESSPELMAGELAAQIGGGEAEEVLAKHRLLLVLDDVREAAPVERGAEWRSSVVMTARSAAGRAHVQEIASFAAAPVAAPANAADRRLWQAGAACRRQGFPLELAAEIAGLESVAARDAAGRLVGGKLWDPMDAAGARFRAGAAAAGGIDEGLLRRRHAEALHAAYRAWRTQPARAREWLGEVDAAMRWAVRADWRLAVGLANQVFTFLKAQGRLREAVRVLRELRDQARERLDSEVADQCAWELSWLVDDEGAVRRQFVPGNQMDLFGS